MIVFDVFIACAAVIIWLYALDMRQQNARLQDRLYRMLDGDMGRQELVYRALDGDGEI